jgi:hypothetical protein
MLGTRGALHREECRKPRERDTRNQERERVL